MTILSLSNFLKGVAMTRPSKWKFGDYGLLLVWHIRGKPSEENEILLPSSVFFLNIFAQIGVILRDSHGVAQVRYITGNKILRILKAKGNFYRVSWILFSFPSFWWWNYENWLCNTLCFYQGLREAFLKIFTSWSKKQLLFVNILKSIGRCVL